MNRERETYRNRKADKKGETKRQTRKEGEAKRESQKRIRERDRDLQIKDQKKGEKSFGSCLRDMATKRFPGRKQERRKKKEFYNLLK